MEKRKLELDLAEVKDNKEIKERKISVLQRKVSVINCIRKEQFTGIAKDCQLLLVEFCFCFLLIAKFLFFLMGSLIFHQSWPKNQHLWHKLN